MFHLHLAISVLLTNPKSGIKATKQKVEYANQACVLWEVPGSLIGYSIIFMAEIKIVRDDMKSPRNLCICYLYFQRRPLKYLFINIIIIENKDQSIQKIIPIMDEYKNAGRLEADDYNFYQGLIKTRYKDYK